MNYKSDLFVGISLFYIIYLIFPIFTNLFSPQIPCIVVSTMLLLLFPTIIFTNKTFIWLIVYFIVTFLFFSFGRQIKIDIGGCTNYRQLIIEYAFLLPNVIISIILLNLKEKKIIGIIGRTTLIIMCLSYLIVLPQMQYMDLRNMALSGEDSEEQVVGTINYTLLHAYIFLIPALYYCVNLSRKKLKWYFLIVLLLTIYVILKASITTTISLMIMELCFFIVYNSKNRTQSVLMVFAVGIILILLGKSGILIDALDYVRPFFEDTAVEEKLESAKNLLLTGQESGSIETRSNLHDISLISFFDNILIGGGQYGGHSSILDRLGWLGIIGFVPYIMIYVSIFKQWCKKIGNSPKIYYYISFASVLVFLYTKGVFGQEGNLFFMVLLPVVLLLPEYTKLSKTI